MASSYKDLIVWQRALQMSVAIYKLTADFPREEIYGLTSQLWSAGVSVASNIAEGYGRISTGEYKQFLGMARGSNLELQTQLQIAAALGFGDSVKLQSIEQQSNEVSKMLRAILKGL